MKHEVHCHVVLLLKRPEGRPPTPGTSFSPLPPWSAEPVHLVGAVRGSGPRAGAGRQPVFATAVRSPRALSPPFFLLPGGGRQRLSLRSFFPVPCAFPRFSLHPPPTLPQIYSSTLGELGQHPASPIGLPSNWCTHTSLHQAGRWGGGSELAAGSHRSPGIGRALPHLPPYPSPRCSGDPDTDWPPSSSPSSLPSAPGPGLTSREGGSEVMKEGKASALGDWVGGWPRLGDLQSHRWRRGRRLGSAPRSGASESPGLLMKLSLGLV